MAFSLARSNTHHYSTSFIQAINNAWWGVLALDDVDGKMERDIAHTSGKTSWLNS